MQPGGERRIAPIGAQGAGELDADVLGDVLGLGLVAGPAPGHAEDALIVPVDQGRERSPAAPGGLHRQAGICHQRAIPIFHLASFT